MSKLIMFGAIFVVAVIIVAVSLYFILHKKSDASSTPSVKSFNAVGNNGLATCYDYCRYNGNNELSAAGFSNATCAGTNYLGQSYNCYTELSKAEANAGDFKCVCNEADGTFEKYPGSWPTAAQIVVMN